MAKPKSKTNNIEHTNSRGPTSWVSGSKIMFFTNAVTEWNQAKANNSLDVFAELMATRYDICYGHLHSLKDDLPDHITPSFPTDEEVAAADQKLSKDQEDFTDEEKQEYKVSREKFRSVRPKQDVRTALMFY